MDTLEHPLGDMEILRAPHRRRRAAAIVFVGAALFASVGSFLATTGISSPSVAPPPGTPSSGNVADVTTYTSTVNRTNGAAQLQVGVTLAKIVVSSLFSNGIRVNIDWTNTAQAAKVLNNPNVQISIGLYHTIHTGSCNTSSPGNVDAPLVSITDTDSNTYCAALDQGATGQFASPTGKLLLAQNQVGGFLLPSVDGSGALAACASSGTDTNTWCQPASLSSNANQRVLFVVASVVTPGGIPQGQQPSLATMSFYVGVNAQS